MLKSKKILFQLSGSIACYKSCDLISKLVQAGHEVQTVVTKSALKFIGVTTLEGLTGKSPLSDVFEEGRAMDHIHLMRWADLILLSPATANTINKLASGISDDTISTLFLAHDFKKPYLVAPAMNHSMYQHPSTQASLSKLSSWGIKIISPEEGALACGETGSGRLASTERILQEIESLFSPKKEKVLITYGGTEEPIDGVRSISNFSTGKTGQSIATYLQEAGYEVTALKNHRLPKTNVSKNLDYKSFSDLDQTLRDELQKDYSTVIHLAAVSDFSIDQVYVNGQEIAAKGKISSKDQLNIAFKNNYKIVDRLKSYSNKPLKVIAFKLTHTDDIQEREKAIETLFESSVDYVVHNDLSEISENSHSFRFLDREKVLSTGRTKPELCRALEGVL